MGHPAGQLAQVFQSLGLLQLQLHALFPGQGLLPLAPHDKPFLGVPALLTSFHVKQFLRVPRVPAVLTGLHIDLLLGVPRVPALLTGLDVKQFLGVPRILAILTGLLTDVWPGPLARTRLARLGHVNHPRPPSCA